MTGSFPVGPAYFVPTKETTVRGKRVAYYCVYEDRSGHTVFGDGSSFQFGVFEWEDEKEVTAEEARAILFQCLDEEIDRREGSDGNENRVSAVAGNADLRG